LVVGGRRPAGDAFGRWPDRRRCARTVDASGARGPRGADPGRWRRLVKRDELIAATHAPVDEADRLAANPSLPSLQVWLHRSTDPATAERLAGARRKAESQLHHDAPRAPRPEKMQR